MAHPDRRTLLRFTSLLALAPAFAARAAQPIPLQLYKNPDCGCCTAWAEHMRAAGFAVTVTETTDAGPVRRRFGMPERFAGCHSAVVAGYVVEGHVPADDVKRLLRTRPAAVGLSVPGMPVGSPGMEAGDRHDPYDVLVIDRQGQGSVFAHYPKAKA